MTLPATIDSLKSSIGRRGGLAKANRFALYITHPGKKPSLLNTDFPSIISGSLQSLFSGGGLNLKKFFEDPRDMYLLCESITMPGRQIATVEHFTDLKAIKKPYAYMNEDVTAVFHLTNDMHCWNFFNSWQQMVIDTTGDRGVAFLHDIGSEVIIQVMAPGDFVPAKTIRLRNAFPTTLASVELSNASENTTLRVSVTLSYEDWSEESLIDGYKNLIGRGTDLVSNSISLIKSLGKFF